MAYGVKLEVWGDYAAFNRPEMKVERVSYEVMTPSAARGILEAIYWKPQMRWVVDCIRVLAPIRFTHIRRNEIANTIPAGNVTAAIRGSPAPLRLFIEEQRQQRAAMILRDVRFGIEAHIEVLDPTENTGQRLEHPAAKHVEAFKRRASKGQYFHHPYLGCREFPASFRLLRDDEAFPPPPAELAGRRDLGLILWDITFVPDGEGAVVSSNTGQRLRAVPKFFRVTMEDGCIQVPPPEAMGGAP
jgi:CRISPR-associated protein Cas5d